MISGIYKITCLINDKIYVGSSNDLEKRKYKHFWYLSKGNHPNYHLQNAYNLYGFRNFEWYIIEYCQEKDLFIREQFWINILKPKFNIAICVESPMLGQHHTEDTKQKMSDAKMGKIFTKEHKQKLSNAQFGKHQSIDHKQKISNAISGKNHPFYGKHHTENAKQKMSKSHVGIQSGEDNPSAKFTKKQIIEIRKLYEEENMKICDIVKLFNSKQSTISKIVNYKNWRDV